MKKISVFNHISIDGFFAGPQGEIDWFKFIEKDDEFEAYAHQQSQASNTLVFGHTTYEMMKSYWPTPDAIKSDPDMANVMNNSQKIVFSKKLKSVEEGTNWKNVKLMHDINREEMLKLKEKEDITILGSGTIVQQFTDLGLIDSYQLVVVPVVLGEGKSMFKHVKMKNMELVESKAFKNGIVLHTYKPAKNDEETKQAERSSQTQKS